MKKVWFEEAWEDYTYWQTEDKKTFGAVELMKPTDSYTASAMAY